MLSRLQPLRVRRTSRAPQDGWLDATFRLETIDGAEIDVLSLGPHIHVLEPADLRDQVADRARRTSPLYAQEPTHTSTNSPV